MKRTMLTIFAALAVGLLVGGNAVADQTGQADESVAAVEDCAIVLAKVPGVHLPRGTLTVRLVDQTAHPAEKHLQALAKPACLSVYGARQAAALENEHPAWLDGLPFLLEDKLNGIADQAQFQWDPLAEYPRSVHVGAGMFSAYAPNEMVWALGHELGHGVYNHSLKKSAVRFGSALAGVAGAGVAVAGRGWLNRSLGAAVAVAGASGAVCGKAMMSVKQELNADTFGVRAAAQSGIGMEKAKSAAIAVLKRHPATEESCLSAAGVNTDAHPGTEDRISNVQTMH